jgi:hypothetical protein
LNDVEEGGRTQWRWTTGKKPVSFTTFYTQMITFTKTGSGQTQRKLKSKQTVFSQTILLSTTSQSQSTLQRYRKQTRLLCLY